MLALTHKYGEEGHIDYALRLKKGKEMLKLGLKYAFDVYGAKKVSLGVFENNEQLKDMISEARKHALKTSTHGL